MVKQKLKFFWGVPPFSPLKWGQPGKMTTHDCLWPTLFMSKSYHTIKMRMLTKKLDKKIFIFGRMVSNFVRSKLFLVEPTIVLKISYLAQFWKFLSEFWHVISNYTYQQVINSNMGSNMAPLMVSGGGPLKPPPPVGATESDRPWEIGLIYFYLQGVS